MRLLEQEARSSGGLSYRGIFNHHIVFCDGHWVPLNKQPRTETVIPDGQVVEEKAPANCFAKQIAARAGAIASQSPLLVEKRAYSERAGHASQLPRGYKRQDGRGGKQTRSLVVERGTDGEASDGSNQRVARSRVPDQSNNDCRLKCIEAPRLNSPPIERGCRGEEVTEMTQRGLELIDVKGVGVVFGKPRHRRALDAFTSSMRELDLKNNDTCCSMSKNVSKTRMAPPAPLPTVQKICVPATPRPTHSKTRIVSPNSPPMAAVSSIHGRFPVDSCPRRLIGDVELHQDDNVRSVIENVSNRRTVPR